MATRIQLRRDTAAQWTANNPTLATGEAGYETDTAKLKIGNGSSAWNSLQYIKTSVELGTDTSGNYIATIAGTTNQISVSGSGSENAAVTLSLPQDINTTSSPTFAGATIDAIRVGVTGSNEIDTASGNLTIDSAGGTVTVDDNLIVSGDLTINGTTTIIDTTTLLVEDKNIELGVVSSPTDTTANGGGITLKGTTDKTFNWIDATDSWTSSEHIDLANGKVIKINGTEVLSATQFTGNSATVTNGVYTTGSYANPSWITSLSESKVLPSQDGNNGKYLTTNGTSSSWATLDLSTKADLSGATFTGTIITAASTTSISSIRIPHGTAPSSPTNGDIWTTTLGAFIRINDSTVELLNSNSNIDGGAQ